MLSTPYIRPTSSIKSSLIEISPLLLGADTTIFSIFSSSCSVSVKSDFLPFIYTSNANLLNTSNTSFLAICIPNTSFIFWKDISISLFAKFALSYFAVPPTTSPAAYSSSNLHALSIAMYVLFGSSPFSNLELASLLNIFCDVFLIFTPSNIAASIITFFVLSVISVSSPPITPARPIALSPSEITMSSSDKILSFPSNVDKFSCSFAILTSILPFKVSAS